VVSVSGAKKPRAVRRRRAHFSRERAVSRASQVRRSRAFGARLLVWTFAAINRVVLWHRLPGFLGAFNLVALRTVLREKNLAHPTRDGTAGPPAVGPPPPVARVTRTADGRYNDLRCPMMGVAGTRFGRNFPLHETHPEDGERVLSPSPRRISEELLARREFTPAPMLNLLAAAWIQFQTHDWFNHGDNETADPFEIELTPKDGWHERPMRIPRTRRDPTRTPEDDAAGLPPTYVNTVSHWWDASAIYGSDAPTVARLRARADGKLRMANRRLPLEDPVTQIVSTGFSSNWWIGLELLHTLFALEHNAICDRLKLEYPSWDDEQLFQTARLVNAALLAKIHTIEWTPAILGHPALQIGMNANWWGLAGERLTRLFGRIGQGEILSGIPGSPTDHHAAPFALTEEFVSVYRMHPLLPDELVLRRLASGEVIKTLPFKDVIREKSHAVMDDDVREQDVLYSFGVANPGALILHNYPEFLRKFQLPDDSIVDLAAIDVLRDRERGVPRYNRFRELLRMPRVASFEELTPNRAWAQELSEIYGGDIDRLDLMVGMFAEMPPKGFGFSDTAFRIFILMASRRIKSDRFFTQDFSPRLYTQAGLDWIGENDMTSILLRHYPELKPALQHSRNAFAPWTPSAPS
jgi:hypothetical protein